MADHARRRIVPVNASSLHPLCGIEVESINHLFVQWDLSVK